tara:strand:+ start:50 stop:400 length:351 start_codon:yes stop_codon:yes gene_type:complete
MKTKYLTLLNGTGSTVYPVHNRVIFFERITDGINNFLNVSIQSQTLQILEIPTAFPQEMEQLIINFLTDENLNNLTIDIDDSSNDDEDDGNDGDDPEPNDTNPNNTNRLINELQKN